MTTKNTKPISQKQLEANKANAQKGGVKTEEGKQMKRSFVLLNTKSAFTHSKELILINLRETHQVNTRGVNNADH